MKTLEVKAKGKVAKGNEAITALYLLLTQGVTLGCHYTDTELPPEERITWRPIKKNGEVIGSVSWSYTDEITKETVWAIERALRRERVEIKVAG